jgi:hypothetical protein
MIGHGLRHGRTGEEMGPGVTGRRGCLRRSATVAFSAGIPDPRSPAAPGDRPGLRGRDGGHGARTAALLRDGVRERRGPRTSQLNRRGILTLRFNRKEESGESSGGDWRRNHPLWFTDEPLWRLASEPAQATASIGVTSRGFSAYGSHVGRAENIRSCLGLVGSQLYGNSNYPRRLVEGSLDCQGQADGEARISASREPTWEAAPES